jgi:UDP-N-acetylglucosamine--N-acetylmuramyl-(pentapeptide) pyrophosphoryl-undecaprenol N-acetylglucosamine transferase
MQQPKVKILISGGGTGGHVFPAIAIADAIKRKVADAEILFVGALGKLEMQKVPTAGYPIKGLWISGFQRNLSIKNLLFPLKLLLSLMKASGIIRKFKPQVVVGVGGYASGPTCKMAARKKIPVLLQEQNSFPGITNKLLAKEAATICVAYDGMEKYFPKEKIIKTGNPVRQTVIDIQGKKQQAFEYFELKKGRQVVLIVGGSQGAVSINESILKNLTIFTSGNLQLIWQTGKNYAAHAKAVVSEKLNGDPSGLVKVHEFITKMDLAYAAADIVISRAGAIAISELCAVSKPCILIPLPSAAEDHQTKNAMALAEQDAAIHLKDPEAPENLGVIVINLANDGRKKKTLATNIGKMAAKDSADIIANEVLKLIK